MIVNVHERTVPITTEELGEMLETLAGPGDRIWHSDLVEPIELDRGLDVGSRGGHGAVRYEVVAHDPGRLVRFRFAPGIGLDGHHGFEIFPGPTSGGRPSATLRHTIVARPTGVGHLLWPLICRLHDGALEDMLDHVERAVTGIAHRGQATPRWVRAVGARTSGTPRPRARRRTVRRVPARPGPLLAATLDGFTVVDCLATPLLRDDSTDAVTWATAVLGREVPGVRFLMRLRDTLVRPFRLQTMPATPPATGFPLLAQSPTEALLGLDDRHLSFRVEIRVDDGVATVTTTVQLHNVIGRLYWAVVRWFHPHVVRRAIATTPVPVGLPATTPARR